MKKLLTSVIAVFLLAAGMIEFWAPQKAEASTEQMLIDLKERCPENKDIYECPIIETLMEK